MAKSVLRENIRIAFHSIKGQLLRTILTALIIAIGIMALVGILTAIDAIKAELTGKFALLGANTFSIQNSGPNIQIGRGGERPEVFPNISWEEATAFKARFTDEPAVVSLSYRASGAAKVKFQDKETNPNVTVFAADENYLLTGGYELASGRFITKSEVEEARPVAVIAPELSDQLFPNQDPLGNIINIGGERYKVVGLTAKKGNSMGFGGDKSVFIPITKARKSYNRSNSTYAINVMALNGEQIDQVVSEATAMMRMVRKLNPKEESNFNITKSDNLSQTLLENLSFITIAAVLIGAITMFGAAIALMNIMLVSVTERTREIGVRKAIGAKSPTIRQQFLTEAILICVLGGLGGIILGITIGNITSALIGGTFIVPWLWMALAIILCLVTGLVSGLYPAYKASSLDPIESLRYE